MTADEGGLCPHCKLNHALPGRGSRGRPVLPQCLDSHAWTDAEHDEWRADVRKRWPMVRFAPSTAQLGRRFGDLNRRPA